MVPVSRPLRLLAASIVGVSASKVHQPNSQIAKVIQLLKDMKSQVDAETASGEKIAEETENKCIKDITQLEGDVKYSTEKTETAAATKEDQAAKASAYATEASELVPQIAAATESKKQAKAEHNEAVSTFNKEEAELSEAVTMLTQAYSVLKRSLALVQTSSKSDKEAFLQRADSGLESEAKKAVAALSVLINSAWVSTSDASSLQSFIQSPAASDDLSFSQQPQASTKNYVSKSGSILEVIQSMQDKASEELTKLREKALKDKHAFELLSQDLTSKVELLSDQLSAAKTNSAEAAGLSQKAAAEEADTSEALASFKSSLTDTKAGCEKAAKDWEVRKTEALEESATIQQAVDVLGAKFGASLIQLKFHAISSENDNKIAVREKVSAVLRKMSEKYENFAFMQAANSAEADPFTKVRKMIQEMIVKLEDDQAAEAAKEGKCQADTAKGKMEVKVKTTQLKKLQARSDKANAKVSELATEISELTESVKLLKASQAGWTTDRNASRTENAAAIQEAKESIEALNAAIGILTEFYGGGAAALVQTGAKAGKLSDKAEAVIGILETAESDFEKIRQSTESAEKDAQSSYEKDMQDSTVSIAKQSALIEGKTSEQAAVKVQVGQIDEDLGNASEAYDAATKYLSSVLEMCANKPMSFEERQAKRQSEIEGLRTALNILSGDE